MGCASSKIDDLPAVILCKDRVTHLDQAVQQRWALSEAHVAYTHSLRSVGLSLRHFFDTAGTHKDLPAPVPVLQKDPPTPDPTHDPSPDPPKHSDGHLQFRSSSSDLSDDDHHDHHFHHDDDDDDSDDGMMHHLPHHHGYGNNSNSNNYGGQYGESYMQMNVNFMKRHVTPAVSYQQKPFTSEAVQFNSGDPSSSSSYFNYNNNGSYPYQHPGGPGGSNYNNPPASYSSYYDYGGGGGAGGGGYYGGYAGMGASTSKEGERKEVVPPPPPPVISTWDFLYPFESIESGYAAAVVGVGGVGGQRSYTPSRDSREVREEEGIPDLEDEGVESEDGDGGIHEVVKEVHGHQKLVEKEEGEREREGKASEVRERESGESKPVEYEVHMVDKKVVGEEGGKGEKREGGKKAGGGSGGFRSVFEVVQEIQVQFERASACGSELDKVLEVGKLRYHRKNAAYQG